MLNKNRMTETSVENMMQTCESLDTSKATSAAFGRYAAYETKTPTMNRD